ncbi:MAG: hypothetical protein ACTSWL_09195 [Promethearchaeota archaeon]
MINSGIMGERGIYERLKNVPESEMLEFNKKRTRKYRLFYLIALIVAIIPALLFFFVKNLDWLAITLAVLDFGFFSIVSFQRRRWKRIFENLLYMKRRSTIQTEKQEKFDHPHPDKYQGLKTKKK